MSLIDLIQDNPLLVLLVCVPLIVIYGRVLVKAALGAPKKDTKTLTRPPTIPLRKMPPKPGSQPKPPSNTNLVKGPALPTPPEGRQEVLPGSIGAGISSHQKAGSAKTVKLPVATPNPTDAPSPTTENKDLLSEEMDGLFGSRENNDAHKDSDVKTDVIPGESPTSAIRRKASRLQELGFHHSIPSDDVGEHSKSGAKPTPPLNPPASQATPGTPEAPRSSTAELTSILERIDKFLAEDTPSSPAPTLSENKSESKVATTTVMKSIESTVNAPAASTDTTKAMSQGDSKAAPATASNETNTAPGMRKTQPMWARPDVTDDDLKAEEPRKSNGASETSADGSAEKDSKKPDGDQQRLF
jgi:hypothetical protein